MSHAQGLGWVPFLWDNEAYPKEDETVKINAVPAGYFVGKAEFEAVQVEFESQIAELLRNAKSVAPVVIAYPSPVFVAGLKEVGADYQALEYQLNFAHAACVKVGGVHCLDPAQRFATRDMYYNLTHFNQRGHRAMGEWLAREVAVR